MKNVKTVLITWFFCLAISSLNRAIAQIKTEKPKALSRPVPPTRDPYTAGYVAATELPDGNIPSPDTDGNFIIGPTHNIAKEMIVQDNVPQGTIYRFIMNFLEFHIRSFSGTKLSQKYPNFFGTNCTLK